MKASWVEARAEAVFRKWVESADINLRLFIQDALTDAVLEALRRIDECERGKRGGLINARDRVAAMRRPLRTGEPNPALRKKPL